MKPYYEDEFVTLYHGDCREVLGNLDLSNVAMTVTDPPYGETSLAWDRWPEGWVAAVAASTPTVAPLWCFGSMRMFFERLPEFDGWTFGQEIVWEKHNGSGFHADRFKRVHEFAAMWYRGPWGDLQRNVPTTADAVKRVVRKKGRPTHTGHIDATPFVSEDGGPRLMRSVLRVRSCHGHAEHPTQKPIGIVAPLIAYSARPGGAVLDVFGGAGSVALASKMAGLPSITIEADERYCEIAAKRLAQGVLDFGSVS